jgi:hypothetical protein
MVILKRLSVAAKNAGRTNELIKSWKRIGVTVKGGWFTGLTELKGNL